MARAREWSVFEKQRLRAVKIFVLLTALCCLVLSLWQCIESSAAQTQILGIAEALFSEEASDGAQLEEEGSTDALGIAQEGILLKETNEEGSIRWYQSNWDVSQSKVLIQRSLALRGWQLLGTGEEQILSFHYAPSATANGGSLIVAFYYSEAGCSILIELL